MQRNQQGFTLIELVIVIVILGILSAFALPRFADLGADAREASLDGAVGAVRSSSSIARSAFLAQGEPDDFELDGVTIDMSDEGYPSNSGIVDAAQLSDDFVTDAGVISLADGDGTAIANCNFNYDEDTGQIGDITKSGC